MTPIVARQAALVRRTSPEGSVICRPRPFAGGQRRTGSGAAAQLAAVTGLHLDVVNAHAQWDELERHAVADARLNVFRSALNHVAGLETFRRQDVRLHAVLILDQGDAGRAVRIVLDADDRGGLTVLDALEVDDPILALVTTPTEPGADDALVVAAALFGFGTQQRLFRLLLAVGDVGEIADRTLPPARRHRFVFANGH